MGRREGEQRIYPPGRWMSKSPRLRSRRLWLHRCHSVLSTIFRCSHISLTRLTRVCYLRRRLPQSYGNSKHGRRAAWR